jgi:hypothetical protein
LERVAWNEFFSRTTNPKDAKYFTDGVPSEKEVWKDVFRGHKKGEKEDVQDLLYKYLGLKLYLDNILVPALIHRTSITHGYTSTFPRIWTENTEE